MSWLDYFRKMPKPPMPSPVDDVFIPTKKIITYGFRFKFFVNYTNNEDKKGTYNWSSDLFNDFNSALAASRKIIEKINTQVNSEEGFVFIVDISIKTENFISATASDPTLVVFVNGVAEKTVNVVIFDGGNAVIQKSPEGDTLVGDYKIIP